MLTHTTRWSHARGNGVVPSRWQATTMAPTRQTGWGRRRPALDGVRGVAILLVLFSHLVVDGKFGGLAGVTVFFVLSGYLITSILYAEWTRDGAVSMKNVYRRRVRRLAPALLLGVAAVTFIDVAKHSSTPGWSAVLALSYAANWFIIGGASGGSLDVTWSLAVEEQFYVVWPALFIVVVRRLTRRELAIALLTCAGASLAIRMWLVSEGASVQRVAFGTDTRAEALLLGCALALSVRYVPRLPLWSTLPTLLIVSIATQYDRLGLTLGLTLTAVMSGLVIRAAADDDNSLLAWAPLGYMGRISYGVYLIHMPILNLVLAAGWPHLLTTSVTLVFSIALAAASFHFIERPVLNKGRVDAYSKTPARAPLDRHTQLSSS